MKSQQLQELINKIFSDDHTREQFKSAPETLIARFDLSEEEKRAVMDTHARMGLVAGNSVQLEATLRDTSGWFAPSE